jgi:hypothetical protein
MAGKPYCPSSGTEGMVFDELWCNQCARDAELQEAAHDWPPVARVRRHALPPAQRNHLGKGNVLLFPRDTNIRREGPVQCRERLGGLLRYYHQEAA